MADDRLSTCWRETSHACAYWRLQIPFDHVAVWCTCNGHAGVVRVPRHRASVELRVIGILAGPAGEAI